MSGKLDNAFSPIDPDQPEDVPPTGGGHLPGMDNPPRKEPTDADEQGIGPDEDTPPDDDPDQEEE